MPVFVQRVIPVTTSKERVNAADLKNPKLPNCPRAYWIADGNTVREMTVDEKATYYPSPVGTVDVAAEYIASAETEREKALLESALKLAKDDKNTDAQAAIEARIAALE